MKFAFNASGANAPLIRDYDIATSTAIKDGEAVGIADNKVVAAESGDHVLGVAAEEHTGKHDELNARADGGKIRVNIAPQAIYEASLPCFTATGGSATTLVIPSSGVSTSLTSGRAVLVSKADSSANTDKVGTSRRISACAVSGSSATLTLASGGVPESGDVYRLIPDVGDEMYLDASGCGVCFFRTGATVKFICAYSDEERGVVGGKLKAPVLA